MAGTPRPSSSQPMPPLRIRHVPRVDVHLDSPVMRTRRDPSPGQLALGLVDDAQAIRDALVVDLRGRRHRARFISEMGMNHGAARIDLAVIDDSLDGYEIKSSQDDLRRLEGQAIAYGQVFDRLTLVGVERHLEPAARVVPAWWGLILVDVSRSVLEPMRHAGRNPTADPASIVRLLWHSELEAVLQSRTGRRPSGMRAVLAKRLVADMPPDEVRSVVRRCLTTRATWRAAG
jgi:hypothetical protein